MDAPKINLHVHSNFSDGRHSIHHIIKRAINYEIKFIAITDHFSDSWKSKIIPTLNSTEKIDKYLEIISDYQNHSKMGTSAIKVIKGIEIDISSSEKYVKKLIDPANFEIILFEYLETLPGLMFIEGLINNWRKKITKESNLPILGLAHFDPSHFLQGNLLDRLINLLKKYEIYFEFNSRYSEYYSRKNETFFEEIKKEGLLVGLGSDAHGLRRLNDLEEPLKMIEFYGLESNLFNLIQRIEKKIEV